MTFQPYVNAVIADSPAGYWKFDQTSGNATDSSGNNRTLTYSDIGAGTPTYRQAGPFLDTYAVKMFNLGNKWNSSSLSYSGNYSVEMWFKTDMKQSNGSALNSSSYGILVTQSGRFNFGMSAYNLTALAVTSGGNVSVTTSTSNYNDLVWRHLVMTVSYSAPTTTLRLYANGSLLLSNTISGSPSTGSAVFSVGDQFGTAGTFCEMALYPTALSQSRVQAHFDTAYLGSVNESVTLSDVATAVRQYGASITSQPDVIVGARSAVGASIIPTRVETRKTTGQLWPRR